MSTTTEKEDGILYLKPKDGLHVCYPGTAKGLPLHGDRITGDLTYWTRQLEAGDVVVTDEKSVEAGRMKIKEERSSSADKSEALASAALKSARSAREAARKAPGAPPSPSPSPAPSPGSISGGGGSSISTPQPNAPASKGSDK